MGMTVAVPGGTDVTTYDPSMYGDTGLEDVGASDVIIPRLRIVHDEGVFQNNLSNEKFSKLTVVLLGLVKQRIMWDANVEDGDVPQCKSPDFDHGFPNLSDQGRQETHFPWAKSNFTLPMAQPLELPPGAAAAYPEGYSSNGNPTLPCSTCIFQEWDKGDWKQPPCSEQHTYPLLYQVHAGTDEEDWLPALLTVQKTGIKPSRTYISSFAQSRTPMFTVQTEIGLTLQSRGIVKYSVPTFRRVTSTDPSNWTEYAEQQRSIRRFIRTAPRRQDEGEEAPPAASANVNTPPPTAPPAQAAPVAEPAPPAVVVPPVAATPVQAEAAPTAAAAPVPAAAPEAVPASPPPAEPATEVAAPATAPRSGLPF